MAVTLAKRSKVVVRARISFIAQTCLSVIESPRPSGDVGTIVHPVKTDLAHRFVSASSSIRERFSARGHAKDAPARGQIIALLIWLRSRMKNNDAFNRTRGFESRD